ncbi:hypothetical protein [Amycolatopsis kentuckyensis]|uniref:hypothetical protein n=1 Tax=Amycolatopsis kentuckyensis TaxID=218823 RepID=UPI000A364116|nr:hypothetical protein [Amycolatopsis kentuckyensis]
MTEQKPSIGRIVHYALSDSDVAEVNRRRNDAYKSMAQHRDNADGSQVHVGNAVNPGEVYPMVITRVWGDQPGAAVNGQVLLDGNDSLWVTSRCGGDAPGQYAWPARS